MLSRIDTASSEAGIVRQISAIFDTRALGYESTLVAARYPEDRLFEAAAIVGGHPGVSHNYRRTHALQPLVHAGRRARLAARPRGDDGPPARGDAEPSRRGSCRR